MARSKRPAGLPEFEHPPLVEVATSIQFDALDPMQLVEVLGALSNRVGDRYPRVEQHPPLPPAFEIFGVPPTGPQVQWQLGPMLEMPRFWLVNDDGTELVQLQSDRFVHNWRKVGGGNNEYPRYERIRRSFFVEFLRLNRLVESRFDRSLIPNQCDLTYVNHIDPADAFDALQFLQVPEGPYNLLTQPEDFVAQIRFTLQRQDDDRPLGRLHVQTGGALNMDGKHVLQLAFTARGRPLTPDIKGARDFMDMGREAIVRNFAALTTERMHEAWGRRN